MTIGMLNLLRFKLDLQAIKKRLVSEIIGFFCRISRGIPLAIPFSLRVSAR